MRARGVAADGFSYSTLLAALTFLPLMEADAVAPDLVLFSNLIHLALRAGDAPKALALFSSLRAAGIRSDLKAYNAAIAAYCKPDLLRDAKRLLLLDVPTDGVAPDAESYAPVLAALARRGWHLVAVSLFSHMRAVARSSPTTPSSTSCSTRTGSWTSRATLTGSSGPCARPGCRRASSRTTPCSACTATPGCSGRRSTCSASCAAPPPTAAATASLGTTW
uniref:Pentatricopeptide repeat-containing protein n=1 Tax=Triticum urartu TaxID=4572 RepID=A0A8R7PM75_TRIUA